MIAAREAGPRPGVERARTLRLTGTVVTERGSLEGKDEAFIDTSASNPWTLIVGVYAGLAADDDSALKSLHELSRHACGSPQVTASPAAEEFARALVAATVGQDGVAARHLAAAREAARSSPDGDRYWLAQVEALEAVLNGRRDAFLRAQQRVRYEIEAFEAGTGVPPSPEGQLKLPARGLEALARRRGLS